MDVSNHEVEPDGQALIQMVVSLTGLPEEPIRGELNQILEKSGHDSKNLTLEQLRIALAAYLESIQADLLEEKVEIPE